jgi:hypothetical protein
VADRPRSVSQGVYEVLRQAERPLFLAQIIEDVGKLPLRPCASLRRSVQSALRRSPQILTARSGAYVLAHYLLKGAVFRHVLTDADISGQSITLSSDARFGMAPSSYDARARWDMAPCQVSLEEGPVLMTTIREVASGAWGLPPFPSLGEWYDARRCQPGDQLLVEITDGESRLYHLGWVRSRRRPEPRMIERSRFVANEAHDILLAHGRPISMGKLMAFLVTRGAYHSSTPPEPIDEILRRDPRFATDRDRTSLGGPSSATSSLARPESPPVAAEPSRPSWLARLLGRR